jgi:hypothetical protein
MLRVTFALVSLLGLSAGIASAQSPDVLPLTARSFGLYASRAWLPPGKTPPANSYLALTQNLDFSIRSLRVRSEQEVDKLDLAEFRNEILAGWAHTPRKTVLVRIDFWGNNGDERHKGPLQDTEVYTRRVLAVVKQLEPVLDKVQGITLSEENVHYAGRPAVLKQIYEHCKTSYPKVRIWQWWSPSVAVPDWHDGVYVPADGWIIDCYTLCKQRFPDSKFHLTDDPYRRMVQKYLVTGKPLIGVLWASSAQPDWYDPDHPANKDHINMWEIMDDQFKTHLNYNIPTCFFWTDRKRGLGLHVQDDPLLLKINEKVASYVERGHALPETYAGNPTVADVWSNNKPPIALAPGKAGLTFTDDFKRSKFLDETNGTGFRDLAWSPHSLAVRGYHGRPVNASIVWRLTSKAPLASPVAVLDLKADPGATVQLSLSADHGKTWVAATEVANGKLTVSARGRPEFQRSQDVWVRVHVTGEGGTDDRPIARLIAMTVRPDRP